MSVYISGFGPIRVTQAGLCCWAKHFFDCKQQFKVLDKNWSPVPYFLLCRAIELALKSLHTTADPDIDLKKLGHNLEESYRRLPDCQKVLTEEQVATLSAASKIYNGKGFEYFNVAAALSAFSRFPDSRMLHNIQPTSVSDDEFILLPNLDTLDDVASRILEICAETEPS